MITKTVSLLALSLCLVSLIGLSPSPGLAAADGSSSGGGGNTLKGRPIEAYVGEIASYRSYSEIVEPLLIQLESKLPTFSDDLRAVVRDKLWYFVPVELDTLPSAITGIQFSSDQTFIQLKKSVWVDKRKFNVLSLNDQATLILHELVMGALMAKRDAPPTAEDSDLVRSTTIYLMKQRNDSAKKMQAALEALDRYPTANDWGNSSERLYVFLQRLKENKKLPNEHGYYHNYYDNRLETVCMTKFALNAVDQSLEVSVSYRDLAESPQYAVKSEDKPTVITVGGKANVSTFKTSFGASTIGAIRYAYVENDSQASDGEIHRALYLTKHYFDDNALSGLYISWAVCRDEAQSGHCKWEVPSGAELQAQHLDMSDARTCAGRSISTVNVD